MSLTLTTEIKDRFFDRVGVIERIGKVNARRLSRMGAFIRRRAMKTTLRNAPKTARGRKKLSAQKGNRPPRVYSSDPFATLRNIQFGLTSDELGVMVGPIAINSLRLTSSSATTVPELLEFGGTKRITQSSWNNKDWTLGDIPQAPYQRQQTAHYAKYAFMGPALDEEIARGTVNDVWSTELG